MTTTNGQKPSPNSPSKKAVEAAALTALAEILKADPGKKPSLQALQIAAKILANRAMRSTGQPPQT